MTTTSDLDAPEVSVVLPVHDVAPWLRECLSSLLDDQDVPLEVIAVDDGSTDGSLEILQERAAVDERLRVVRNPGTGGAEARNHGARLARAAHLAFADGDDLVPRGAYRAMLDSARRNDADMVVGSYLKFFPNRTWRPTRTWAAWQADRDDVTLAEEPSLLRNRACWNRLFRTDFWAASGITFPSVPRSNDVVPMTRALLEAKRINVVTDTVYLYRARPGATSMTARAHGTASFLSYLQQELASFRLTSATGDRNLRALHESLFLVADGWVHLRTFLAADGFHACTPAELAELQEAFGALHDAMAPETVLGLGREQAWGLALASAGEWELARQLVLARAGQCEPEAALAAVARRVAQGVGLDEARFVTRALVLGPLGRRNAPAVDAAGPLLAHRDLLARLYDEEELHQLLAPEQQLVRVVLADDVERLTRLLSEPPLRFAFRRVTVEEAGPVARVVHLGPTGSEIAFALVGDDGARLPLEPVDVRWEEGPMMVALPLRALRRRGWNLRVEAVIDGTPIEAPVALSPLAPEGRVVEGRQLRYTRAAGQVDAARIVVGPGPWRRTAVRAARRARRTARRTAGRLGLRTRV